MFYLLVGQSCEVTGFNLRYLIGPLLSGYFYRYTGSLTTPECDENVTWSVFWNTLPISQTQVDNDY